MHPDHSLSVALQRMGAAEVNLLPVVSRADIHQLLGIVTLEAVLSSFRIQNGNAQEK